jgi:hypothetical protein
MVKSLCANEETKIHETDPGEWPDREIDARIFQKPLCELANVISLKVEREGIKVLKPAFAAIASDLLPRRIVDALPHRMYSLN